jgi:glycosyltransferase involved in cell wall biosynthesis
MKILYFISVHGHGRGGHFHSLNHISKKIGEEHDVKIISFGPGKSDIIESNSHFLRHIDFNGLNIFKLRKIIKQETRKFRPDIYHCFDEGSYNIVRLIIPANKNKLILNKCGGPNPKYFPHVKNLILFSVENQDWFKNQNKYKNTNIHLIPNRVKPLQLNPDFEPIEENSGDFIFMRICRIGHTYKKSIQDSINLISKLLESNIKNVKLYLIGVVQDADVFEKLNNHELIKSGYMVILTESKFTNEASKMLYLADAVIGTGRGLMEAASLGKPLLAIDKNGEIPVLLNKINFDDAFKTNFSERNVFPKLDNSNNIKSITQIINDTLSYNENSSFVLQSFEKYFSLEKAKEAYPSAYNKSKTGKRKLIADLPFILRSILSFYRSYLNLTKKQL